MKIDTKPELEPKIVKIPVITVALIILCLIICILFTQNNLAAKASSQSKLAKLQERNEELSNKLDELQSGSETDTSSETTDVDSVSSTSDTMNTYLDNLFNTIIAEENDNASVDDVQAAYANPNQNYSLWELYAGNAITEFKVLSTTRSYDSEIPVMLCGYNSNGEALIYIFATYNVTGNYLQDASFEVTTAGNEASNQLHD